MKQLIILMTLLASTNAFALTVTQRLQQLESKINQLQAQQANTLSFKRYAGGYFLEHGNAKIVLLDNGTINIETEGRLNIESKDKVTIHTDSFAATANSEMGASSFTMGNGIEFKTAKNLNMKSNYFNINAEKNIQIKSKIGSIENLAKKGSLRLLSNGDIRIKADKDIVANSVRARFNQTNDFDVKAAKVKMKAASTTKIEAGGSLKLNGSIIKLNNGGHPVSRAGHPVIINTPATGVIAPGLGATVFVP